MIWTRLVGVLLGLLCLGAAPPPSHVLIRGGHVFDGTGAKAVSADVLISGDRIVAVGPDLQAPLDSRVVDARGMTVLPGLHDLHTHLRAPGFDAPDDLGKAYAGHLVHGVTSVNDFSVSGEMLAPIREMVAGGDVAAPQLQLAIRLGVPGGHGTEYGWGDFFTMEAATPRAAELAMDRALAYRPDVIKVFADGWRYGRSPDINSMSLPTLRTIVNRAHEAGIAVITHTVTLDGAKTAAAAGVDALGHGIGDTLVDDELIALMKANGTAYVPTMVVYEPQQDRAFLPAEWERLRPQEQAREDARLARPLAVIPELEARRWNILRENLRRLRAGGVKVGIGTDAGIGGVYQGSSAVREIRLLTEDGFTPAEALAAATSVSAAILRREDRGRVAPGQRADLLLVGGRPDQRIEDLYDVRRVFVSGREVALEPLRRLLKSDEPSPLPVHRLAGPIDVGGGRDGRTDLGTLPVETSESGIDHSHLHYVRQRGEPGHLFLFARMGAAPQPYANLVLPLTPGPVHLADARGFDGIAFEARGSGRYALLLDSYGVDSRRMFRTAFTAGQTTREVRIPFKQFSSSSEAARLDLARLRAVVIRLEGEPGGQETLELGNIRFYR
ncbi:amidohydrolase family protein [Sphingosinicella sp. YJ22]|uniref:amidohydrolase family protein n=1 Tax=Sphingosinicella sp. YJ22 TaxID=1104780 RepID=UPI00140C5F4D|nr:amidohydrolase family protein [Sphingosinicella sp. YJ22]